MVTVRHQRMTAALMAALAGDRGAAIGVGRAHGDDMLVVVALMGVVQVTIVKIVHVALVQNAYMAAVLAMNMRVVGVDEMSHTMLLVFMVCGGVLRCLDSKYTPVPVLPNRP
jgi:hypothetical protein